MILELAYAAGVALVLYRAVCQYRLFYLVEPQSNLSSASVTVIIPVRNEEQNIGPCLDTLAALEYAPGQLQVLIVDDDSDDQTVAQVTARATADMQLARAGPLPAGWTGKCHACWQGALRARGEYLCFMDADVRATPLLLQSTVAYVQAQQIDMLSLQPFQEMRTWWERLILPAGFLLLAATQDLRSVSDPDQELCTANGQFILIRRRTYETVGGHAAVRNAVAEDSALASIVKEAGDIVALRDGSKLLRVRMYRSLAGMWEGLGKNIPEMLHGIGAAAVAAVLACALAVASIALPVWDAVRISMHPNAANVIAICAATGASLALLFTHVGIARRFRFSIFYALFFPIAYFLGAALVTTSVIWHLRGRVVWKGRAYTPSPIIARAK